MNLSLLKMKKNQKKNLEKKMKGALLHISKQIKEQDGGDEEKSDL